MNKLIAHVSFYKEVEKGNWGHGCDGDRTMTCSDKFTVSFTDIEDLKRRLAQWVTSRFDITETSFMEYVHNEYENNEFIYSQHEDGEGDFMQLTEDNPDGYLCDYLFYITKVTKEVSYIF